jgi:hypothetical protein
MEKAAPVSLPPILCVHESALAWSEVFRSCSLPPLSKRESLLDCSVLQSTCNESLEEPEHPYNHEMLPYETRRNEIQPGAIHPRQKKVLSLRRRNPNNSIHLKDILKQRQGIQWRF